MIGGMDLMPLTNAYLDGDDVVLITRESDGRRVARRERAQWVSYVERSDLEGEHLRAIRSSYRVRGIAEEGRWLRISWTSREARYEVHATEGPFEAWGIKTYEADVHPVRRILSDRPFTIQRPRRAYLDLETDSRVPFSRKEEARILSWALVAPDASGEAGVLDEDTWSSERELLEMLVEALEPFDQVCAWNGDKFDFPVFFARAKAAGARIDTRRWSWMDHLELFKKQNMHSAKSGQEKRSYKLGSIAAELLGSGKDDLDGSRTWEAWSAGGDERERLLRYNVRDTDLLRLIEAKTGFLELFDSVCEVCRVFPETWSQQSTVQFDGYMLRRGYEAGMHFPTKVRAHAGSQYEGAYVMDPPANLGVLRDVHVADFSGLYPSIILAFNMSAETLAAVPVNGPVPEGHCRTPTTGAGFRTDVEGMLASAVADVRRLRAHWKKVKVSLPPGTPEWADADRRSTAYKVIANSFYGVVGSPFSRFFSRQIAEGVTLTAKWLLELVMEEARARGMRVVYADTDSIFVEGASRSEFEMLVRHMNADVIPRRIAAQGCKVNPIELAYEKQFARVVFTGKKHYAGNFVHYGGKEATVDSAPEVRGLEYKRGDAALLAAELQYETIDRILKTDEGPEEHVARIAEWRRRVMEDPLPIEHVELSAALSKPTSDYGKPSKDDPDAGSPPHVRAARVLEARGEDVREGTRIAYVVVDGSTSPVEVIPASDYVGECDRHYLWNDKIYPPTRRLLEAAFPAYEWGHLEQVRPKKGRAAMATGDLFSGALAPRAPVAVALPKRRPTSAA